MDVPWLRMDAKSFEVFASRGGFLEFDKNVFVSRTLQDHCLFKIFSTMDKEDEDSGSTQFFNVFDWLAGDARRASEPFDAGGHESSASACALGALLAATLLQSWLRQGHARANG